MYSQNSPSKGNQMRDALQKAGFRPQSRESHSDHRQGPGRAAGSKPNRGARTSRADNLTRLSKELEYDLLSSALGVSEQTLRNLAADRPQGTDEQSLVQISVKLKQAGFPPAWLETPNAQLYQASLANLRKLATQSSSKAAVRRMNLKTLAAAFRDRMELLADALELSVNALSQILDGVLEFDDQRAGHINPKLVSAGFPDGWLEQSEVSLAEGMVSSLEALATDSYEEELSELESSSSQLYVATLAASTERDTEPEEPPVAASPVIAAEPVAAPAPAVVAPIRASLAATPVAPEQAALFPESEQSTPQPGGASAAHHVPSPSVLGGASKPLPPVNPKEPIMAKTTHQAPTRRTSRIPTAPPMPGVKAAAAGSATTGKKRGSRLAAVRGGAAMAPGAPAVPPALRKAAAPVAAPAARKAAKAAAKKTPAAKKAAKGKGTTASHKASNAPYVRGTSTLTVEQSLKRSKALDTLLADARRGAKVTVWREILGSSQAYAGNIRQGVVLFKDEHVDKIEQALALPHGWLDDPTFPPPSLAAWVTDASIPLPGSFEEAVSPPEAKAAGAAATGKAGASVGRKATKGIPPAHRTMPDAPPMPHGAAPQPAAHAAAAAAAPAELAAAPAVPRGKIGSIGRRTAVPAVEITVPAQVPAAAPVAAAPVAAAAPAAPVVGAGFTWTPGAPKAAGEPGPLVQALVATLNKKAAEGTFTEDDAWALLSHIRAQSH
jgi:hypothetical protein